jgi:hypothetical protein
MTADLEARFQRWSTALDPDPQTVERIGKRLMEDVVASPSKQSMLARYRDACASLATLQDAASEEFFFAKSYRDYARRAALSVGATPAEIEAIDKEMRP